MALTFERKPDKGGETNHIGCIGIAAEGAEPPVLLLRTGTDEARCKASGFLTKSVATYSGTKYVSGSEKKGDEKKFEASFGIELSSLTDIKGLDTLAEEKGIGARGTAKLALQMGFYLDRPGLSVFGDFKPDSALSEIQEKYAKENAWFTLETGKKLEASEKKEPKAKGKKEKAKKETEPKEKAETNGAPAEEGKKKKKKEKGKGKGKKEKEAPKEEPKAEEKKEKGKKKGKKEKAEAKPEPEPPAEKEGKKKKKGKGKGKEEEPEPVAEVPKKKGKGKGKEKEEPKPVAKEEKPKKGKGKGKGEKEETPAPTTSPKGKGKKGKAAEEPAPAPAKNGKGEGKAEEPKETGKKGKGKGKKEKFTSISKLEPDSSNVNLKVTVVSVKSKGKGKKGKGKGKGGKEAVVGDSTGLVTLSLTTEQAGQLKAGNCISIRGGNVDMVTIGSGGFVRLKVDGDLDVAETGGPEPNSSNDISATEYELVQA